MLNENPKRKLKYGIPLEEAEVNFRRTTNIIMLIGCIIGLIGLAISTCLILK